MIKCKKCSYKQTYEKVDYDKSIREQKIITIFYDKACIRCFNIHPKCKSYVNKYNLSDEEIIKKLNVDLTRIIHDCESFECDKVKFINDKYDNEGNCIEVTSRKTHICKRCYRVVKYSDIAYTIENPCSEMKELTEKRKQELLIKKHRIKICPITQKPYEEIKANEWESIKMFSNAYRYDIICSECKLIFEQHSSNQSCASGGFWWK